MADKFFTPKGGWQRKELTVMMAKSDGKTLIGREKTWQPEFFKVPCKEDECGICNLLEENKK